MQTHKAPIKKTSTGSIVAPKGGIVVPPKTENGKPRSANGKPRKPVAAANSKATRKSSSFLAGCGFKVGVDTAAPIILDQLTKFANAEGGTLHADKDMVEFHVNETEILRVYASETMIKANDIRYQAVLETFFPHQFTVGEIDTTIKGALSSLRAVCNAIMNKAL